MLAEMPNKRANKQSALRVELRVRDVAIPNTMWVRLWAWLLDIDAHAAAQTGRVNDDPGDGKAEPAGRTSTDQRPRRCTH